jgi:hypothetical protein
MTHVFADAGARFEGFTLLGFLELAALSGCFRNFGGDARNARQFASAEALALIVLLDPYSGAPPCCTLALRS